MTRKKRRNVFVPHRWKYKEHHDYLLNRLEEFNYKAKNYSVPPEKKLQGPPTHIKNKIKERIKKSSFVIVPDLPHITNSKYIPYELEVAKKEGKCILAVKKKGYKKGSQLVESYADIIVTNDKRSLEKGLKLCDMKRKKKKK
jgi:hypothetical protein